MVGDEEFSITLSGALPSSPAYLVLAFARIDAPFKGGVLVPDVTPPSVVAPLVTLPDGTLVLSSRWPVGVPSDSTVYYQYWLQDGGGVFGWAASNGLAGRTP